MLNGVSWKAVTIANRMLRQASGADGMRAWPAARAVSIHTHSPVRATLRPGIDTLRYMRWRAYRSPIAWPGCESSVECSPTRPSSTLRGCNAALPMNSSTNYQFTPDMAQYPGGPQLQVLTALVLLTLAQK
jgi:hypothetical protein